MEHTIIQKKNVLRYVILYSSLFTLHAQAENLPAGQGMFVISQIRDSVYNLKQAALQITQQVNAHDILANIKKLNSMVKTAKDNAGITQAEGQLNPAQDALDQAIAALYTKAIDQQAVSLYHKIYRVLQEIFDDPIIKEKSNMILGLQQEMAQRIITNPNTINHWTKQIQNAGQKISRLAANQEKAVDQVITQGQSAKAQLATARMNSTPLALLEQQLYQKKIALQKAHNNLPTSVKIQIKQLQDTIQKSNFLLQYIQDPRKAAAASPETLIAQETDPAFATTQ